MRNTFRKIVVLMLLAYVSYIGIPYLWPLIYDQSILDALTWNGYGGKINVYGFFPYLILAVMLISLVGLLFFKLWARNLFLVVVVVSVATSPFMGLAVQGPAESIPAILISLGMGAILSLSFLSGVKSEFK